MRISDFHHFEVFLARAAFGARPVHRHVLPAGPGRDAFFWNAGRFVIDEAADEAHVRFEYFSVCVCHFLSGIAWGSGKRTELESRILNESPAFSTTRRGSLKSA